jgi:cytochrome b6-f complex iron-sulfur subunit
MDTGSRRTFLGVCLGAVTAIAAGAVLYPILRYLSPNSAGRKARKVEIASAEVPEGGARFFEFDGRPGVLIRRRGGSLAAFSAVCTHLGCVVQWQKEKEEFLCPCHGGRFSAAGAVIVGPPPRALDKLPVKETGDTITVG